MVSFYLLYLFSVLSVSTASFCVNGFSFVGEDQIFLWSILLIVVYLAERKGKKPLDLGLKQIKVQYLLGLVVETGKITPLVELRTI
jgi:hypothetical protein